jgi:hypothetical protein
MDRRKFLRGSGIVAGALGGLVLGYREYVNRPIVDKRVLDQINSSSNTLSITQGYYPKTNTNKINNGFLLYGTEEYELTSVVSFKPGPDGNLYIKVNDEWKQVLTS